MNPLILIYESQNYKTENICRIIRILMHIWVTKYLKNKLTMRFNRLSLFHSCFINPLILIYEFGNYNTIQKTYFLIHCYQVLSKVNLLNFVLLPTFNRNFFVYSLF